ncbi:hypothetical protein Gotur_011323 [Gossypium turneri]
MSTSGNNEDCVACPTSGRNTKKVWFKENEDNITEMIVDPAPAKTLSGLPGYLYNKKILEEIGGMIERVVKLDFNTNKRLRRRFSRLAIFVNLDKPLILQILINDKPQRVEYKSLSTICFSCGRYDYVKDFCSFSVSSKRNAREN